MEKRKEGRKEGRREGGKEKERKANVLTTRDIKVSKKMEE